MNIPWLYCETWCMMYHCTKPWIICSNFLVVTDYYKIWIRKCLVHAVFPWYSPDPGMLMRPGSNTVGALIAVASHWYYSINKRIHSLIHNWFKPQSERGENEVETMMFWQNENIDVSLNHDDVMKSAVGNTCKNRILVVDNFLHKNCF